MLKIRCQLCKNLFDSFPSAEAKFCSQKCVGQSKWKSESGPGYVTVHHWIYKKYGKANKCENLEGHAEHSNDYHWALRKGCKYEKKRDNFAMLCTRCHKKYDYTAETRLKLARKVRQLDHGGTLIKEYEMIKFASKETGILSTAISNSLNGRALTTGGFFWQYA